MATIEYSQTLSLLFIFQINLLDIGIYIPQSKIVSTATAVLNTFCVTTRFTGLRSPLPSLPNSGKLTVYPYVEAFHTAPWYNLEQEQMMLHGTSYTDVEDKIPERAVPMVTFRLVYSDAVLFGWMALLPFLFTAFTTQLQWLVIKADQCSGSNMVTSVLLIQSLVNSQKPYTGHANIATEVIYMTYAVAGMFVSTVAIMTFINTTKTTGKIEHLVKHQDSIFRYMRFVGLSLTPLYIPILVFSGDESTGDQERYNWLWPLVVGIILVWLFGKIVYDLYHWRQRCLEKEEEGKRSGFRRMFQKSKGSGKQQLSQMLTKSFVKYSANEIKEWITTSSDLLTSSPFTSEELASIACKFHEAKVDGRSFLRIAEDPEQLVKFVNLSIGEAYNFKDAIEILRQNNILDIDDNRLEQAMPAGSGGANVMDC